MRVSLTCRALAAVVLVGSLAAGQLHTSANSLTATRRQVQTILSSAHSWEQRLHATLHADSGLRARPADTDKIRAAIAGNWRDVTELGAAITATARAHSRVQAERSRLLNQLTTLKRGIHRQLGNVRSAVVQLYDLSRISPLEQVLEATSLTAFSAQQSMVAQVGDDDRAILARVRAEYATVRRIEQSAATELTLLRAIAHEYAVQRRVLVWANRHLEALLRTAQRIAAEQQQAIRRAEAAAQRVMRAQNMPAAPIGQAAPVLAPAVTASAPQPAASAAIPASAAPGTRPSTELPAASAPPPSPEPPAGGYWTTYLVTAYCLTGVTASGTWTNWGTVAATLPFYTRLYVPGYGYGTVLDRGGAIGFGHIDLYMPSCSEAIQWGARVMNIEIFG